MIKALNRGREHCLTQTGKSDTMENGKTTFHMEKVSFVKQTDNTKKDSSLMESTQTI